MWLKWVVGHGSYGNGISNGGGDDLFVCVARTSLWKSCSLEQLGLWSLLWAIWGADFAFRSGCSLVLARCHFELGKLFC